MIEVKKWDDLEKLEKEVNGKRMTLDEAIAAIAKRFGLAPFGYVCRRKVSIERFLSQIWIACEHKLVMDMDHEEERQYSIQIVESGEMAARSVRFAKEKFGFDLDYSLESLDKVETILKRKNKRMNQQELAYTFGSYVGEVMIRHGNGKWVHSDTTAFAVELPARLGVWPIAHCYDLMCGKIKAAPPRAPIGYLSVWAQIVLAESRYKSQQSESVAASS